MQRWEYACATVKGITGMGELVFYTGNQEEKTDWGPEAIRRLTNEGWEMAAALALPVPAAHISEAAGASPEPYQVLWFRRPAGG